MLPVLFLLIQLHGLDGREVDVSIDEITSLQCRLPGAKNQLLTDGVNAVIGLTDGKTVNVVESCSEIREIIRDRQRQMFEEKRR